VYSILRPHNNYHKKMQCTTLCAKSYKKRRRRIRRRKTTSTTTTTMNIEMIVRFLLWKSTDWVFILLYFTVLVSDPSYFGALFLLLAFFLCRHSFCVVYIPDRRVVRFINVVCGVAHTDLIFHAKPISFNAIYRSEDFPAW